MADFYDIIIIGGGPAGLTASIYCARADKKVAVFEKEVLGGKITYTEIVENIPGLPVISGQDFADELTYQAESCGAEIIYDEVLSIERQADNFVVHADASDYICKSVIIASGTKNRRLGLDNEDDLIGKGICFCATCDGPLYQGKSVVVVGGGNSAVTEALQLSKYCENVKVIQNLPTLTAEPKLVEALNSSSNISVMTNTTVTKYLEGGGVISGIEVCSENGVEEIMCSAVFIAIGLIPNTDFISRLVDRNERDEIKLSPISNQTSVDGVFACGDCTEEAVKQVAVSCGNGAKAAVNAIHFVNFGKID